MPEFLVPITEPYDFDDALAFLSRHATFGIEELKDDEYIRYFPNINSYGTIQVSKVKNALNVSISTKDRTEELLSKIKNLFDTEHDPSSLPLLTGVRAIGSFDPFEAAVSIILGQLVSIKQATLKLGQLNRLYGKQLDEKVFAFPAAEHLKDKEIEEIGITRSKATVIRELSAMVIDEKQFFSKADNNTEKKLLSIKGIGPWTSQLILMRCFGNKDAFPKNDLFIARAIEQGLVDEASWAGKRAYLAHYLWAKAVRARAKSF